MESLILVAWQNEALITRKSYVYRQIVATESVIQEYVPKGSSILENVESSPSCASVPTCPILNECVVRRDFDEKATAAVAIGYVCFEGIRSRIIEAKATPLT